MRHPLAPIALSLGLSAGPAACTPANPEACTIQCGDQGVCPDGTGCATDGYCHAPDDQANCLLDAAVPDGPTEPDGPVDVPDAFVDLPDADTSPDACAETSFGGTNATVLTIPDVDPVGITSPISADTTCAVVQTVQIRVDITHSFRGDVSIALISPLGQTVLVKDFDDLDSADNIHEIFDVAIATGQDASGEWRLLVADHIAQLVGTLDRWSIGINQLAP